MLAVDGGTESLRACVVDSATGEHITPIFKGQYKTSHPKPGWAAQAPEEWIEALKKSVKDAAGAFEKAGYRKEDITGMCCTTTCCSVVFLDKTRTPLCPALLWMDARAADEARKILEMAPGDPALRVNSGGEGPISAENFLPKCMWFKNHNPALWDLTETACEYQDFVNFFLTGKVVGATVNAAVRWHCDGEVIRHDRQRGLPVSLYEATSMGDLPSKLPTKFFAPGDVIGTLSAASAKALGLSINVKVIQGGPDAFVGMVGLGCTKPGEACLITGSSHLHCVVSNSKASSKSCWGAYSGAPLPGVFLAEGGQSSTGSILNWCKREVFGNCQTYRLLDEAAAKLPIGAEGLVALETFQGSRTPDTDPKATGALIGLTLAHTQAHIWRALLEAVCLGSRKALDGLSDAGHPCQLIKLGGGATNSPFWVQMHADVTNTPIIINEILDAPLHGCAVLASVGAGYHESVDKAVDAMVRVKRRIEPNPSSVKRYEKVYKTYKTLQGSVKGIAHQLHDIRGGGSTTISPSLLSADWSNMKDALAECEGLECVSTIHIDIFDGFDVPSSLTFGPKMVKDLRRHTQSLNFECHLVVKEPEHYILDLQSAGGKTGTLWQPQRDLGSISALVSHTSSFLAANTLILQFENLRSFRLRRLLKVIAESGMEPGISIAPRTKVDRLDYLIKENVVKVVNILGVNPCIGGQTMQKSSLEKVKILRERHGDAVRIIFDGGVNEQTMKDVVESGADTVVSGSYIFHHEEGPRRAIQLLSNVIMNHHKKE